VVWKGAIKPRRNRSERWARIWKSRKGHASELVGDHQVETGPAPNHPRELTPVAGAEIQEAIATPEPDHAHRRWRLTGTPGVLGPSSRDYQLTSHRVHYEGKSGSGSGGSLVDVVQAFEDRPGDHLAVGLARTRHRSLQSERSVGPILVVVAHELG
jgi:hypothetical protein